MLEPNISDSSETNPKPDLVIHRSSLHLLMETAKWGKFLSIVGFIGVGLIIFLAFAFGFIFERFDPNAFREIPIQSKGLFMGIYLVMGVLYFFPCLYLFQFSQKTKAAVISRDPYQLGDALAHQKSLYKFMGILTIVGLCFYALIFIFAALGAMMVA